MSDYLPNNIVTRTARELVDELIDAMIANPACANQPIGFSTTPAGEGTIFYVRQLREDSSDRDAIDQAEGRS